MRCPRLLLLQTNILPGDLFPGIGSVLVRINPLDVISIITLSKATYGKMVQNLGWENGKQFERYLIGDHVAYNARIVIEPDDWSSFISTESDDSGYQCQVPESKNIGIKQAK